MEYVQDEITYRIEDNTLKGWRGKSPFKKPEWNGSEIVEGWTQADEDARLDAEEELTVGQLLKKFEEDGIEFYERFRTLVRRRFTSGDINTVQYKAIRDNLGPVMRPLRYGDWDLAQDNINALPRPNGILGDVYDFVKNRVDSYVNSAFNS
jgi:hypothetical protein